MSWAPHRQTSRIEDQAYSLLGIFNVSMPMLYGEGPKAFIRLQEEILRTSTDHSIFAWDVITGCPPNGRLLADSPRNFTNCRDVVQWGMPGAFEITNRGLQISLRNLKCCAVPIEQIAILNCRYANDLSGALALRLRSYRDREEYYAIHGDVPSPPLRAPQGKVRIHSRLTFVNEKVMRRAKVSTLQITRKFEPDPPALKFWIPIPRTAFRILQVYPKDRWDSYDRIMYDGGNPCGRAGVVLEDLSAVRFIVAFGFNVFTKKACHEEQVEVPNLLMPAIWARRWSKMYILEGFCEAHKPCDHEQDSCFHVGCPLLPASAEVSEYPTISDVTMWYQRVEHNGRYHFRCHNED